MIEKKFGKELRRVKLMSKGKKKNADDTPGNDRKSLAGIKARFFSLSLRRAGNVCHGVTRPLAVFHFRASFRYSMADEHASLRATCEEKNFYFG